MFINDVPKFEIYSVDSYLDNITIIFEHSFGNFSSEYRSNFLDANSSIATTTARPTRQTRPTTKYTTTTTVRTTTEEATTEKSNDGCPGVCVADRIADYCEAYLRTPGYCKSGSKCCVGKDQFSDNPDLRILIGTSSASKPPVKPQKTSSEKVTVIFLPVY